MSRPARGAWIEILAGAQIAESYKSRPARGAWIEMQIPIVLPNPEAVAPRKGCVD